VANNRNIVDDLTFLVLTVVFIYVVYKGVFPLLVAFLGFTGR